MTTTDENATTVSTTTATTPPSRLEGDELAAFVQQVNTFLDTAEAKLGPEPAVTTSSQKRRIAKPRKGADKILPVLAPIIQQHHLESPALNTRDMMSRYQAAQALLPLMTRLQKMTKRVNDEAFNAQTDAWGMGLQFYTLMKRRARIDGQVAQSLAPLAHVFAYRHGSVRANKPTKVQTRVKARLKKVTALATRHGVAVSDETSAGEQTAGTSETERRP